MHGAVAGQSSLTDLGPLAKLPISLFNVHCTMLLISSAWRSAQLPVQRSTDQYLQVILAPRTATAYANGNNKSMHSHASLFDAITCRTQSLIRTSAVDLMKETKEQEEACKSSTAGSRFSHVGVMVYM